MPSPSFDSEPKRELVLSKDALKFLQKAPPELAKRIVKKLDEFVESSQGDVIPVKGTDGLLRLRVGEHRILLYSTATQVSVTWIGKRSDAYKG